MDFQDIPASQKDDLPCEKEGFLGKKTLSWSVFQSFFHLAF